MQHSKENALRCTRLFRLPHIPQWTVLFLRLFGDKGGRLNNIEMHTQILMTVWAKSHWLGIDFGQI